MTAIADLLSPADRDRLAGRLAELRGLDKLVRERAGVAPAPVPPPLHRMGQRDDSDETATTGERP